MAIKMNKDIEKQALINVNNLCNLEHNTLFLPIFSFGKDKVTGKPLAGSLIPIYKDKKGPDGKIIASVLLTPHGKAGRPGETDYKLFRAVEDIAMFHKRNGGTIPKKLYVGSVSSFARRAGLAHGDFETVDTFIKRMSGLTISGERAFFEATGYNIGSTIPKGNYIKENLSVKNLDGGKIVTPSDRRNGEADKQGVWIYLSDTYRNNLEYNNVKAIYREYLELIKQSTSKRLLEFLIVRDSHRNIILNYSDICFFLQIKQLGEQNKIKKQINGIVAELEKLNLVYWLNHCNLSKIHGGADFQLKFRLRPLITPAQKEKQVNKDGMPTSTEDIKLIKKEIALLNAGKKLSKADKMVVDAFNSHIVKTNNKKFKNLAIEKKNSSSSPNLEIETYIGKTEPVAFKVKQPKIITQLPKSNNYNGNEDDIPY